LRIVSGYNYSTAFDRSKREIRLTPVKSAPVIEHAAYAVYPLRTPKLEMINELLGLFEETTSNQ
tara:strand:+ start:2920 stop:3111 length:192 start_codon:yes stop_codon:yes gene_type:complete